MAHHDTNIYKCSRNMTGITREQASELIGKDVRTIARYECGELIPADEIVDKMVKAYNSRKLAYLHLKHSTKIGRKYLPEIQHLDLLQAVSKINIEVRHVIEEIHELTEMAIDGIITVDEMPKWQQSTNKISNLASACMAISLI